MDKGKKIRRICVIAGIILSTLGYALEYLAKISAAAALIRLGIIALWIAWYMPSLMKSNDPHKSQIAWAGNAVSAVIILLGGAFMILSNPDKGYLLINAGLVVALVVWFATKLNEPVY